MSCQYYLMCSPSPSSLSAVSYLYIFIIFSIKETSGKMDFAAFILSLGDSGFELFYFITFYLISRIYVVLQ